jgi:hypothetical protein
MFIRTIRDEDCEGEVNNLKTIELDLDSTKALV